MNPADPHRPRRGLVYGLLIAAATAVMLVRTLTVASPVKEYAAPFLSANDRSRWCTIRALGDDGVFFIEPIIFDAHGEPDYRWHTIDLVRHKGPDGREHYYSSKPPLLSTLLAGEYWLIKQCTGWSLAEQPFQVARLMLALSSVLPLLIALLVLARLVEQSPASTGGKLFVVACACFGTFLTTFASTLNNHLPAAISVVFTLAAVWPIGRDGRRDAWLFAAAGFCSAFAAANELPALSFFAVIATALFWQAPARTLLAFLPPALLVAAAALGTNYLAHGTWQPAYAQRKDGALITTVDASLSAALDNRQLPPALRAELAHHGVTLSDAAVVYRREAGKKWGLWDEATQDRLSISRPPPIPLREGRGEGQKEGSPLEIRRWGNWYEYPGTHWRPERLTGVDRGEKSIPLYAFHCLLGHHGLFSLTPIWLLSVWGVALWLRRGEPAGRGLAAITLLLTLVVLAFYFTRPEIDRNYGGVTSGLRWLFWLTPLWLLVMLPAASSLTSSRWGAALALVLLAISAFSSFYPWTNPWTNPWLFDLFTAWGWIAY